MQLCLAQNRAQLQELGYDALYPGRDDIPGGELRLRLARRGMAAPDLVAEAIQHLRQHSPDPTRGLILSEENIPGAMRPFFQGRFFPQAPQRLAVLRAALDGIGGRLVRVVFVLRSYEALLTSFYRKHAEDNPVPEFAEVAPRLCSFVNGWPRVIRHLRDVLAPEELCVLSYDQRGDSRDLLRLLLPDLAECALSEPHRSVNLSPTDPALRALQARYHAGARLARAEWQEVIAEHAGDQTDLGLARFSPEQAAGLQARYAADLERIARMRGVRLLIGTEPA